MKILILVRESICAQEPVELLGTCVLSENDCKEIEEEACNLAEKINATVFCVYLDSARDLLEYLREEAEEFTPKGYDPIGGEGGKGRSDLPAGMRGDD